MTSNRLEDKSIRLTILPPAGRNSRDTGSHKRVIISIGIISMNKINIKFMHCA